MTFAAGDRVTVGPVSIFKSADMEEGDRVRGNDIIQKACSSYSIGDRVTADPIGIRKSYCGEIEDPEYLWQTHGTSVAATYYRQIKKSDLSLVSNTLISDASGSTHGAVNSSTLFLMKSKYISNGVRLRRISKETLAQFGDPVDYGSGDALDIATDNTYIYITIDDTVIKLDAEFSVIATRTIPGATWLVSLTTNGFYVWVADNPGNKITKLNCSDLSIVTDYAISYPGGMTTDGFYIYTITGTTLEKRDINDLSVISSVTEPGGGAGNSICVDQDYVYINNNSNYITKFNKNDLSFVLSNTCNVGYSITCYCTLH